MDDDREIIYLALGNSLIAYNDLLEASKNMPAEDKELLLYIISRHEQLISKYEAEISSDDTPVTISRPSWD